MPPLRDALHRRLLRGKLAEAGLLEEAEITEIDLSCQFALGPFEIELITLTHSIPEPNALVIRTPAGKVLHTGDWKLDDDPLIGDDYDRERLQALAGENILAAVGDSTNAMVEGETGSEAEVREELMARVQGLEGRVAIACFASNVARLDTAIRVAEACGRRVALVGRSMHRVVEAARETGYLQRSAALRRGAGGRLPAEGRSADLWPPAARARSARRSGASPTASTPTWRLDPKATR